MEIGFVHRATRDEGQPDDGPEEGESNYNPISENSLNYMKGGPGAKGRHDQTH